MSCPNQCGVGTVAREDLPGHLKDSCSTALVLCPFKDSGCKHRVRCPSFFPLAPFLILEASDIDLGSLWSLFCSEAFSPSPCWLAPSSSSSCPQPSSFRGGCLPPYTHSSPLPWACPY